MKTHSTLIGCLLMTSVLLGTPALHAENKDGAKKQKVSRIESMTEELGLTDAQQPKVAALLDEEKQQIAELKKDDSLDKDARKAKMKEIRKATKEKMKEVLTPEQQAKFGSSKKKKSKEDA